jgi:hypothetical protein
MSGIPAIWRPVLTLVLLFALPLVQGASWTVWACEYSWSSTADAPDSEAGCCKYEGDDNGKFTTDARQHTGTESTWCVSRGAARPHWLLHRVYGGFGSFFQGHQLDRPWRLRRVWGHVSLSWV